MDNYWLEGEADVVEEQRCVSLNCKTVRSCIVALALVLF
jgi:hypothetical protein